MRPLNAVLVSIMLLVSRVEAEPVRDSAPALNIQIGYLTKDYPEPLPLSLVEPIIVDKGLLGIRLGLEDNRSTGQFLNQSYELKELKTAASGDVADDARALVGTGVNLIVANLEPDDLLKVADLPESQNAIFINARASNDAMRGSNCRQNIFHVAPSYAMRADALAQYLVWKAWKRWFLVHGTKPDDLEYAAAMERSAKKFGAKIVEQRTFKFDAGNRRTDTGHQQIQTQMPLLTQSPPEHDIVLVADADEAFGEYLLWRTAVPKPVAGTQGLISVAWHRAYEQYGGTQLQNRFENFAKRQMTERDYMTWLSARIFGEAVTRIAKGDVTSIRAYLVSKQFSVAGFKGQGMSFRTWDRQLRQPMLLTGPRALVSMSPQDGYLHQHFLTDTLGVDEPETACKLPG